MARPVPSVARPSTSRPSAVSTRPSACSPLAPASRLSATSSRSPSASPTSSSTPLRDRPTRTPSRRRSVPCSSPLLLTGRLVGSLCGSRSAAELSRSLPEFLQLTRGISSRMSSSVSLRATGERAALQALSSPYKRGFPPPAPPSSLRPPQKPSWPDYSRPPSVLLLPADGMHVVPSIAAVQACPSFPAISSRQSDSSASHTAAENQQRPSRHVRETSLIVRARLEGVGPG